MQYTSILKRAVPFVLSATAGFVIASFFVPITAPSFGSKSQSWGNRHECKKLKREFRYMREENIRLRMELENARQELIELSRPAAAVYEQTDPLAKSEIRVAVPTRERNTVRVEQGR